jgi:thiamine biosynthesis lipoprotein
MMRHPAARLAVCLLGLALAIEPAAGNEPLTFAGAAFGTTYRVTLAAVVPNSTIGDCHREVEQILRRIDRAASTWRDDSDAAAFNRATAGEWVDVSEDLLAMLAVARRVHAASGGGFDPTVAPLLPLWSDPAGGEPKAAELAAALQRVGLGFVELDAGLSGGRPRLRKTRPGLTLDLGGIGPGYAVDRIGERLQALGSEGHLVTLGGEVRAWGCREDGTPWRVSLAGGRVVRLAAGDAIATSTIRPGHSPVDPRTGRPATGSGSWSVSADSCAEADAWAVAAAVLGLEVGPDGLIDRREPRPP